MKNTSIEVFCELILIPKIEKLLSPVSKIRHPGLQSKVMEDKALQLAPIWKRFPQLFSEKQLEISESTIIQMISEMLVIGDHYYFILNVADGSVQHVAANCLSMHNLENTPSHVQEIVDLIHPDDLPYVMRAEEVCHQKIAKQEAEERKNLKACYCFRMKMNNGKYQLFHHQSIPVLFDEQGKIVSTVNIHTNIDHISKKNSFIAHVIGINNNNSFYQFNLSKKISIGKKPNNPLTTRESDILQYVAKGYSSIQIAELLGISDQTVRVHRKNILKKTQTINSSSLIKYCVEMGWL